MVHRKRVLRSCSAVGCVARLLAVESAGAQADATNEDKANGAGREELAPERVTLGFLPLAAKDLMPPIPVLPAVPAVSCWSNQAVSERSLALRPLLAKGVPFIQVRCV